MRAFGDICHDLIRCDTLADVADVFRAGVLEYGYTVSLCRVLNAAPTQVCPQWMFRNFTPAWKKFTDQVVIPARNPVLGAARTRHNPFTFIEVCNDAALPTDQRWIWNVTREFGFENGFAVPVHGPAGYVSYVSMGSPESDLDLRFETRAQLQMMALLAHDRCRALSPVADRLRRADAEPDSAKALSDRELECMRWIAAGKTDWEIGMILAISSSTVRFHVDNARRKLDALTRPQAVAILFARGLL